MDDRDRPETALAVSGTLAGAVGVILLGLAVATGHSHQLLPSVRPVADAVALLLARPWLLRLDLALDGLFLCAYFGFFVALRSSLEKWSGAAGGRLPVWLAVLSLSALLDAVENAHVFVMLAQAERGLTIAQGAIVAQAVASQVKLLANVAALFLLSYQLPRTRPAERAVTFLLRWIQLPMGVAVLVLPAVAARPIAIVRSAALVAALFTFASIARVRRRS